MDVSSDGINMSGRIRKLSHESTKADIYLEQKRCKFDTKRPISPKKVAHPPAVAAQLTHPASSSRNLQLHQQIQVFRERQTLFNARLQTSAASVPGGFNRGLEGLPGGFNRGGGGLTGSYNRGVDSLPGGFNCGGDGLTGSYNRGVESLPGGFNRGGDGLSGSYNRSVDSLPIGFNHGVDDLPGSFNRGVEGFPGSFNRGVDSLPGSYNRGVGSLPGSFNCGMDGFPESFNRGFDGLPVSFNQGSDSLPVGWNQWEAGLPGNRGTASYLNRGIPNSSSTQTPSVSTSLAPVPANLNNLKISYSRNSQGQDRGAEGTPLDNCQIKFLAEQHLRNMMKLNTWRTREEPLGPQNKQASKTDYKLIFPSMPNIAKFVYFGENQPLLYCSQKLSKGSYTTRYLVPKEQILQHSIIGEMESEETISSINEIYNKRLNDATPAPHRYCSVIKQNQSRRPTLDSTRSIPATMPAARSGFSQTEPFLLSHNPDSQASFPYPVQAGHLRINIIHPNTAGPTGRKPMEPPPSSTTAARHRNSTTVTYMPVCSLPSASVSVNNEVVATPLPNKNKANVRHFPVTLESRSTHHMKKVCSTSSQTDWSLQPAEPFLFIATNQCELQDKDRLQLREDSETETDEGEHVLGVSMDSTTIPEILRSDPEFALANHKFTLNENHETLAAIQSIVKEPDQSLFSGNCNGLFVGENENGDCRPSDQSLDHLGVNNDQFNFSSDDITQPFSVSESLEQGVLEFSDLMNNDDKPSGVHHLDNIVNDIVVDLMNNNAMKPESGKNKLLGDNDQDYSLDFDVFHDKTFDQSNLSGLTVTHSGYNSHHNIDKEPELLNNINMFIQSHSQNDVDNSRIERDLDPDLHFAELKDSLTTNNHIYTSQDFDENLAASKEFFPVLGDVVTSREFFPHHMDRIEGYEKVPSELSPAVGADGEGDDPGDESAVMVQEVKQELVEPELVEPDLVEPEHSPASKDAQEMNKKD